MIEYHLVRSSRKTLAMEIQANGTLLVRAPAHCKKAEIDRVVLSHEEWIIAHREKVLAREQAHPEPTDEEIEGYYQKAREILPAKLKHYSALIGVRPSSVRITGARKRFGSCSSKGHICFSWRLMQYPDAVIDYVVVHELCHMKHMNHSKAFYDAVAEILPDWKERARLLKE